MSNKLKEVLKKVIDQKEKVDKKNYQYPQPQQIVHIELERLKND